MTGIPVVNVNNNCATGSSAMFLAKQAIAGGQVSCALALGFEIMAAGSLNMAFPDRTNPLDKFMLKMHEQRGLTKAPFAPQMFGNAGKEHMEKYGTKQEHFAKIAYKNHLHSVNNPYSQFRDKYTLEQVMKSPEIHFPLTKLQCCPTSDGAGAAIFCNEEFVKAHGLENQAVEVKSMVLKTDFSSTLGKSSMSLIGFDMARSAAEHVYKEAGIKPEQVGVVELHDCFSANELVTYEAIKLCPEGGAAEFIDSGNNTYGGRVVVNPSGGLISKGHPLGATGLAQCAELCWQLRGMADKRQVPNLKYALQHNLGLGGACVMAVYEKYNAQPGASKAFNTSDPEVLEQIEKKETQ